MNHDIPSTFPSVTDPELKRDLERFAGGVVGLQKQVGRDFARNLSASNPAVADVAASFGQVTRIGALQDTDSITVTLPRPDVRNRGKQCAIERSNSLGAVFIVAPGCFVNGRERLMLLGSKTQATFTFNGEHYAGDNDGAAPWGGL